tara:strand:+ start:1834 stop:2184 length:351 start_codon:yes stop_codon:yes gene_type:complete
MAVTVEQQGRTNVSGNRLTVSLKAATDDTTWDAASFPFKATDYVANPDMVHIESFGGYTFAYDRAAEKIEAFVQTDPADGGGANIPLIPANGLDLSGDIAAGTGVILRIMITGGRA